MTLPGLLLLLPATVPVPPPTLVAAPTVAQERPYDLASAPLPEPAFLRHALRELLARWPSEMRAVEIAEHRHMIEVFGQRAQTYPSLAPLFAHALELSVDLETLLVGQGLIAAGEVAQQPDPEIWLDLRLLGRTDGSNPLNRHRLVKGKRILFESGGDAGPKWLELEQELLALWVRCRQEAGEAALGSGRPVEASGYSKRGTLEEDAEQHVNDPFTLMVLADDRSLTDTDPRDGVMSALMYARSATLIPPTYTRLRRRLFDCASSLGVTSLSRLWFEEGYAYNDLAGEMVAEILEAQLAFEDLPEARYRLALARNMQDLPEVALEEILRARSLFPTRPDVLYDAACIASRAGDLERSLAWLEEACGAGCTSIAWSREDPELEALRRQHPGEFDRITGVRWHWYLGTAGDEVTVVLVNESNFTLTEAVLSVESADGTWSTELYIEELPARMQAAWPFEEARAGDSLRASLTATQI